MGMIYYANPCTDEVRDVIAAGGLGCITTPSQGNVTFPAEWDTIADNGCYISERAYAAGKRWSERVWINWLVSQPRKFRFAVCPDVFDPAGGECHQATMDRWAHYGGMMARCGFVPAFVCQVGCTADGLPDDAQVLFLGGTTEFKCGPDAWRIVDRAKAEGRWVHMGRVNSERRMVTALEMGCDSADGTFLTYGPDVNLPRLLRYLDNAHDRVNSQPPLDLYALAGSQDRETEA